MLKYDTENYFQQFTNFLSEKFMFNWKGTHRPANVIKFDLNS